MPLHSAMDSRVIRHSLYPSSNPAVENTTCTRRIDTDSNESWDQAHKTTIVTRAINPIHTYLHRCVHTTPGVTSSTPRWFYFYPIPNIIVGCPIFKYASSIQSTLRKGTNANPCQDLRTLEVCHHRPQPLYHIALIIWSSPLDCFQIWWCHKRHHSIIPAKTYPASLF